jgi:hypothetical protein
VVEVVPGWFDGAEGTSANSLKLERRVLDPRALTYLREMFDLDTVFCHALADSVDLATGEMFALLPAGVSDAQAHDFNAGFMPMLALPTGNMLPIETIVDAQAAAVVQFLRATATACAVADDANQRWPYPRAKDLANVFNVGEEVYSLLTATDSPETVRAVLSITNWLWHGLVAMCVPSRLPSRAGLSNGDALAACLRSVRAVQAVAYDGEGYVEWRRAP